MEYVKRVLRVLAIALLSPLMVASFCIGIASMPLTYGLICAYFYVKDGNEFNHHKEADYYTDVVFHFFMEDIWNLPTKYILKLK
jgi:hypothetical protein